MYKQVLLGNKEMNVGKIFNPKQGVKGNYVLHIPNKESVVEIKKIFGVQDSVKIFDVIKDTYHLEKRSACDPRSPSAVDPRKHF